MTMGVHIHDDAVVTTVEHDTFETVNLSSADRALDVAVFVQARHAQNVLRFADALRASALKYGAVEQVAVGAI